MIHQELLQDLTESYLKSLIAETSGAQSSQFDSLAPFGELDIDSFYVLKIIRRLETDFGTLPKSLLFEYFTISDLANYFVNNHEQVLAVRFASELQGGTSSVQSNGHSVKLVEAHGRAESPAAANQPKLVAGKAAPIRIREKEAYAHPELRELVQTLFERYKRESSISRGTRTIAPNLFIGGAKRGYFNYGRSKNIIMAYGFTGPEEYFPELLKELCGYCAANNFHLNIMGDREVPPVGDIVFSATPFGVAQRILNLKEFTLDGGAMRRLRYQVSKFEKRGGSQTQEYECGSNPEIDRNIVAIIDKWCESRTKVNPLVHEVREEILAGILDVDHRLFLTYLNDVLQNVILITAMCSEENGYLMDLEFYSPEMPLGGLEFAIVKIIDVLAAEGCDVLSMGATYGCKLESSANADPAIDKILDDLRAQDIFNDTGNLQFKNKFRPDNKAIFLCRPVGSGSPDDVIDIIMMIADPLKNQTPEEQSDGSEKSLFQVTSLPEPVKREAFAPPSSPSAETVIVAGNERSHILAQYGFNPLNIPHEHVVFDLKTDSWSQLHMPSIEAQMKTLHAQLQQPANVDESLRLVFPFTYFVLTASGQAAENIFFRAWPKKGVTLQNLLFPSTIFHQIDKEFLSKELPHPAVFDLNSRNQYKGNMDWESLEAQLAQDPGAIAMVCIEVGNNAAGGAPVSMQHLRDVKALLARHAIPLVIDGTRVVENAQFLIEQDGDCAGKSVWTVVREMLSYADAVIGSLTKDFCVNKGGIIATNDAKLFHRLEELAHEAESAVDLIDRKIIALSLHNRKQIEAKVLRRMEGVRQIWHALREHGVPVVQPAGGHCVLIDVKQIPEFKDFKYPVASFLAWMYVNTGIRGAAHSAGMQRHTSINDLVRLAIPVGMKRDQMDDMAGRLLQLFDEKINIPEIVLEGSVPQQFGAVHSSYRLVNYHRTTGEIVAASDFGNTASSEEITSKISSPLRPLPVSSKPANDSVPNAPAMNASGDSESSHGAQNGKPRKVQDVAIVGMAGRYPKAKNLGELWENLRQGKDCIEEIPADRYELRLKQGATKKYRGGFIDGVDKFDSLFFNISPREAAMLDPQERLFLEVAWEAIEDAGYYPEILTSDDGSRNVGVFVGAVWAMYQMFEGEEDPTGKKIPPNSFLWSIANRVSYWMNFSGPSLTLDTACSSSLTALYLACGAIQSGECSAAIVGGVNLDLHEAKLDINSGGGALSKDGFCRSFGKGANGYVAGEGIGALFLKPFDRAVRDQDNIYGIIKSAAVNHGGRASGYTIPNPKAQGNLILSAFEKANIDARSLSYIEAHGTGTELGDPVEITGLNNAFKSYAVENQTCAIGSIKSNIGHLEAAAGVVSVSKVLLQMKHRQLVPSLHSSQLNEFIDFAHSPFYVVQGVEDWKGKEVDGVQVPLRAGISSFGAGGANAHVILESYDHLVQVEEAPAPADELIFPLSARTEDQLREMAVRLSTAVRDNNYRLTDVAYTLQVGRKSFEHRLAISATAKEELLEKLVSFLNGKKSDGIARGQVKNSESITRLLNRKEKEEFIHLLSQTRSPYELAELWVDGLFADWRGFGTKAACKRVSLPTYPFADKRHWAGKSSTARSFLQLAAAVHPMVDTNESTFERQIFKKTFHDRDFFIYDHHVADVPTLPGVAYLEFARKAGEIAAGRKVQKIRNIVWISPIAVKNSIPKEVFIELKPSDATARFEVFSYEKNGSKIPHSQGTLIYATRQEEIAEPEFIDLQAIRARCAKVIEGKDAYPRFKSFGLGLGPSFQVLHEVYKNEKEILGVLRLPEFRQNDLLSMVLQPSLMDGSLQAGMGAHLGEQLGEMFVPFSIGEVEVLHPLHSNCFSYATEMQGGSGKTVNREGSRLVKSDVMIVDETGKILVKVRESVGVPLRDVYKKTTTDAEADGFSKLYYSYEWDKAPFVPESAPPANLPAIVLFDTQETLRDLYRERLKQEGKSTAQIILVKPGDSFQDSGQHSYRINPQNKEDYIKLFQSLVESKFPIENVCFAWPLDQPDRSDEKYVDKALDTGVYSFLFVCQSLIQQKLESKTQLIYLYSTREDETQPANEAASGFIKALRVEHPKLLCKTLEVRQDGPEYDQIVSALSAELQAQTQDATAVRYHAGNRYIKKLRAFSFEEAAGRSSAQDISIRDKGVYLITGGAGGLGLIFAEFLAKEHNAKVVLAGRSRLSPEREAKLSELANAGAEVIYLSADMSNREDVSRLVADAKARFGQINGIIHAAGVLRDSLVRNKKPEEMSAVFAPKIYGTLYLDEATQNEDLDFFVMFSSVASVGGNAGQCDYSFANHFMDSFAASRELLRGDGARQGKTLSLNWSLWADGGMKVDEQTKLYFKKTLGIKPLSTATGIEAFVKGLALDMSQFAVVEGVQEKVELAWGLRKKEPAPMISAPASSGRAETPIADGKDADLVAWLQNELSEIVMQFLKLDASDVAADKILLDLGFDSIGLTTFANAINEKFQLDITPVLFFDYPSLAEIAKYLSVERKNELIKFFPGAGGGTQTAAPSQTDRPSATPQSVESHKETKFANNKGWNSAALDREVSSSGSGVGFSPELRFINQPIAIVGMSGVMPQSEDLDEFWENLKNSKDMITLIPPDRWKWEDYYGDPLKEPNKSNSKWGGFMKEIDKFDPLFFGISPREAQMMDPQQRIFLQTVWKAIEDSGQKVSDLSGTKTGLFVGVANQDYVNVMNNLEVALDGYSASGNSHSVLANRISFLLNLRGPSAPIDTACSSSLVALHRAIESIHTGSSDMAIVGGVQIMLSPAGHISFGMAGMLSSDGKCKTFDKRANGYVRGEGCGAIFLKPLSVAEAEGNHIYAVIRATAENHGGRVTTMTAPNSAAQAALLVEAYDKARIDAATVGYIECHGTGTSLGDPIEIQALTRAFSEMYKKHNHAPAQTPHCGLSSVKTNIGHLETAAGISSLLKALLAFKHKQIPANINFEELNPYISLKGTPFYIADKLTPWKAVLGEDGLPLPRRAGVSSFGFGGANAHIVLEEYISSQPRSAVRPQEPQLIVLSAKNEDRLNAYVQSIHAYLEKETVDLADVAYTLQVGRDEMLERLAFVVSSTEDLTQKVAEILKGETPKDCYRNNIRSAAKSQTAAGTAGEIPVTDLIKRKNLSKLAELWTSGTKIDWPSLHKSDAPRRISVPTYPFAKESYWIAGAEGKTFQVRRDQGQGEVAKLHPLVHRNISTLTTQKFASRFTGQEFFLADHKAASQAILPAVAYIEMVSAAGELAGEQKVRFIRDMVWMAPLTVDDDAKDVEVSLTTLKSDIDFAVKTMDKGHAVTHCRGKLGYPTTAVEPESLNIVEIQERCPETVAGKDLYTFIHAAGLNLGKAFQVVQKVHTSNSQCLAVLQLPEHLKSQANQFWLHPVLLDGAVHTAVSMVKKYKDAIPWSIPYSVREIQIFGSLRDVCYAHATWNLDNIQDEKSFIKLNIAFLDKNGTVLVRMNDFAAKPIPQAAAKLDLREETSHHKKLSSGIAPGLHSLVPVWNRARLEASGRDIAENTSKIFLLSGDEAQLDWVRRSYPNSQLLQLVPDASIDLIEKELGTCSFDQLLWIAADVRDAAGREPVTDELVEQQEAGVIAVFRIIKALLQSGHASKKLQWTIITSRTQRVLENDQLQPAHASVTGLVGSLAKEYPQWDLRLIDVDSLASVSARECLSLPWDKQGNGLAHRRGEWFQQALALMPKLPLGPPVYRKGGVYVIIGGAGGVGEVWSRFMVENYQARLVWIGRRECNANIQQKINTLAQRGHAPLYISADAANAAALEQAFQTIQETYPIIHGVVHSAIVLNDLSIARMEEAVFRTSLSAKVDTSVNMDRVFGNQELDFMLFFSSIVSFVKSPGQSNYSAGCTFKDSFAHKLQQRKAYPVKIMNWGYWGSVGVVADESHNELMRRMGVGSIEAHEGMASLQELINSEVRQIALIKTLNSEATAGLRLSATITHFPKETPSVLPGLEAVLAQRPSIKPMDVLERELPSAEMSELATEIFASSLKSLGLFSNGIHKIADLTLEKQPAPYYERWLTSSIRYLQEQNMLTADLTFVREMKGLADLWAEWHGKRSAWAANPNLQAQIALFEACLKALPGILSGKQRATDAIFPNSSMQLVEGIYRGNVLADYFNETLSDTLVSCIEQQLAPDKNRKIRIVEIGAGTGGTTTKLLPVMQRFPVEEYRYTDISKAFLMYAEKHFKPQFAALTTSIFDVSRPLAVQSITAGHYDVAIAANVLHATPNIRETLRNAKAVLKNQGVLLLNEISTWSLFNHLTFGLLEGWWLNEDTALRLPGSPGLSTEKWRELLEEEGFEAIFFPALEVHKLGQQIVAARSNGWVRQSLVEELPSRAMERKPADKKAAELAGTQNGRKENAVPRQAQLPSPKGIDYIKQVLVEKLSGALKIEAGRISHDAPVAEYGVDSIIGVDLIRAINETLGIELETMALFEHSTVDQLAQYIGTTWQGVIAGQLGPVHSTVQTAESAQNVPTGAGEERKARFIKTESIAAPATETSFVHPHEIKPEKTGVEPIAIIGMSGRFAGSESLDEFWENLKQGKCLIGKVSRWNASDCVTPESEGNEFCSHGSFIDSIDRFDPSFFRISAAEAVFMDPQQRLFLEESWKALEDAGYAGSSVNEMQCGIYVGCGTSGYGTLLAGELPAHAFWGNSQSIIPARLAYHLNLQGPAIAVDTACSSSLVSVHLACQGLWSREMDMALAGGICLHTTPAFYHVANRAHMLSPDGECRSFDASANGFVPGEGVGVVVLKRLGDAVRDGDFIHGVIAGSAINQDGTSNGLIAPNARAQEKLERLVYDRFAINPETIQVIEAHGTGTIVGDSIECLAISRAFREYTDKQQFCALGTVKTNIGHTGPASGVAGILKLLLSLKHGHIPASLHFQKSNPAIDFPSNPFYVNAQLQEWKVEGTQKRRGAVSSFGFSGTNAHLVLEEAPLVERVNVESPGYMVVLSARTHEQLQQQAYNLADLLRGTAGLSMNDVSFSLLMGRMHLSHRLSCVARSQEELVQLLKQWVETGSANQVNVSEIQESRVRENVSLKKFGNYCIQECRNATDAASYVENLAAIAELYVKGYSLEYRALFSPASRRIPLPTYPFARERYWVDIDTTARTHSAAPVVPSQPLPQTHTNSSKLKHDDTVTEFAAEPRWLFSEELLPVTNGTQIVLMEAEEKIELFLRQETALHLHKPIGSIATNMSYFDLGLSSLAIAALVHRVNGLLNESLNPSALFEYRDIQSLAAYLVATYPAKVEALTVTRTKDSLPHPGPSLHEQTEVPVSSAETSGAHVPEEVWWQEVAPDDGYEKVTL